MVATLLGAGALSWFALVGSGLDGPRAAGFLLRHGAPVYVVGLWWLILAPLPLLGAAALTRVTPWPWVAVVTAHLAVVVAVAARLRRLVPDPAWWGVGFVVVVGLASVVTAVAADVTHRTYDHR